MLNFLTLLREWPPTYVTKRLNCTLHLTQTRPILARRFIGMIWNQSITQHEAVTNHNIGSGEFAQKKLSSLNRII